MTYDPELLQRMEAALVQPERAEPRLARRRVLLRLSRAPSLRPTSHAWVIVGGEVRRSGSPAIVREVCCTRGEGAALVVRDVEIVEAIVEEWCREAAMIPVPLVGFERNTGLDGVTYTLFAENGFARVKLSWWHDGPKQWRPLTAWARELMKRLHDLVAPGEPFEC